MTILSILISRKIVNTKTMELDLKCIIFLFVVLTLESGKNPEVKIFYTGTTSSKWGTINMCNSYFYWTVRHGKLVVSVSSKQNSMKYLLRKSLPKSPLNSGDKLFSLCWSISFRYSSSAETKDVCWITEQPTKVNTFQVELELEFKRIGYRLAQIEAPLTLNSMDVKVLQPPGMQRNKSWDFLLMCVTE